MTNRRTFLKAAGIFACIPVIEIRQGISMDLMQACCDPVHTRWDLDQPFIENCTASATDGKIGIQVFDSIDLADTDNPLRLPPLANVFDQFWHKGQGWNDWPKADYQPGDYGFCWRCNGHGYLGKLTECKKCGGWGEIPSGKYDDFGEPVGKNCPSCVSGYFSSLKCPRCRGNPYSELHEQQSIMPIDDGIEIQSSYHYLVSQFPGVQWKTGQHNHTHYKNKNILLLEFEGGRGVLMPLRAQK